MPVLEVEGGDAVLFEAGGALPESDDLLRLAEGEGPEEHRIHDAEDRRIGADSQGEHDGRDGGEAGGAPEQTERVAEVLGEGAHEG